MAIVRAFVAIAIPEELKHKIAALQRELNYEGIKPVERENLHITLKFIGEVDEGKLWDIEQALRKISFKNFPIYLGGVGVFPHPSYIRVVWVGCKSEGLHALAKDVNQALSAYGKNEEFVAHLTIARVKRKVDLNTFLKKFATLELGSFTVERFQLKQSILSKRGPIYSTLAEFNASV